MCSMLLTWEFFRSGCSRARVVLTKNFKLLQQWRKGGVMVWRLISRAGAVCMGKVLGKINSERYREVPEENLLPHLDPDVARLGQSKRQRPDSQVETDGKV